MSAGQGPPAAAARPLAVCLIAFVFTLLPLSCARPAAELREVTAEMKEQALEAIGRGELPDYRGWRMEETDRGVRYVELVPGEGRTPWFGNTVRLHYNLWLPSGERVDSSLFGEGPLAPIEFTIGDGKVIDGWDHVVRQFRPGGVYLVEIPPALAYGRWGTRSIPRNSTLAFSMHLLRFR